MMFIVSIWVYYDPIAREAGLSSKVSDSAVQVSLGFQVLGGTAATLFAGRLRWYPTLLACTAVDFAWCGFLGTRPTAALFFIDAAIFGFIWLFILPFMVPMLIEADPSRRAAVLTSGVGLLGSSIGTHGGGDAHQSERYPRSALVGRRLSCRLLRDRHWAPRGHAAARGMRHEEEQGGRQARVRLGQTGYQDHPVASNRGIDLRVLTEHGRTAPG